MRIENNMRIENKDTSSTSISMGTCEDNIIISKKILIFCRNIGKHILEVASEDYFAR